MKTARICFLWALLTATTTWAQDGQLDNTFDVTPIFSTTGSVLSVAVQPDNKYVAAGSFAVLRGSSFYAGCIRIHPDGSIDSTFLPAGLSINTYRTVQVLSSGKLILAGSGDRVLRLHSNGNIDSSYVVISKGSGSISTNVWTSHVLQDDKLYVGGDFDSINGQIARRLVRLNSDGTVDATFNTGSGFIGGRVLALAVLPDGKIYVGGDFNQYNGQNRLRLVRLHANGTLDSTFNVGSGAFNTIHSMALQHDGKLLITGAFTTFNTTTVGRIVRLNTDGNIDPTFSDVGAGFTNNAQYAIALQADGKILVGGGATQFEGLSVPRLVRLLPSGGLDTSFNSGGTGPNSSIRHIVFDRNGKTLITGELATYNGVNSARMARLTGGGGGSTSIEKLEAWSFSVYPNPATEQIWISGLPQGTVVGIRDAQGRQIAQLNIEDENAPISLSQLQAGLYLLEVSANGRRSFQKLVVHR